MGHEDSVVGTRLVIETDCCLKILDPVYEFVINRTLSRRKVCLDVSRVCDCGWFSPVART